MKYSKYFVYETKSSPLHPQGSLPWIPLMWIDDRYMEGAFYFECIWLTGPIPESEAVKPHSHDFDEYVGFFGSNIEDPFNLNTEVEFWFDDEKHVLTRNCIVYIPKGMWHGPIIVNKIERPIFCLSTSPTVRYSQKINQDPKWSHLKDPPGS